MLLAEDGRRGRSGEAMEDSGQITSCESRREEHAGSAMNVLPLAR